MEEQDKLYTKGFNNGYLLAKHEPEIAAKLTASPNEQNHYFRGLIFGKQEYEKEVREWAKGFSKNAPAKDDWEKGKER